MRGCAAQPLTLNPWKEDRMATPSNSGTLAKTQQFWSYVRRRGPNDCWLWMGKCSFGRRLGYGCFKIERWQNVRAHRIAFFYANGTWPETVRHTCDTPRCCNPRHLLAGNNLDNIADRVARNRSARGTRSGRAKLKPIQVIAIRKKYAATDHSRRGTDGSIVSLGKRYGVTPQTVWAIIMRQSWTHL